MRHKMVLIDEDRPLAAQRLERCEEHRANAAALTPVDMKPVTEGGAP